MNDFENYILDIPMALKNSMKLSDSEWIDNLSFELKRICQITKFVPKAVDANCRFGLVVYGEFLGDESVLKILPHNQKSKNEMMFWEKTTYINMLPLLYSSIEDLFYIMPKGNALPIVMGIEEKFNIVKPLFEEVFCQRTLKSNQILYYTNKLRNRYQVLKDDVFAKKWIELAIEKYERLVSECEVELIHGDLRYSNIVFFHHKEHIIDPLGVNAPKVMEFARYIEDEIFLSDNYVDFRNRVILLLKLFGNIGIDKKNLLEAVFIDSILRTTSSILLKDNIEIINRGQMNATWLLMLLKEKIDEID